MESDRFAEARRDTYHSRRFAGSVVFCVLLVAGGTAWLIAGRYPAVGAVAIIVGLLAGLRLMADRWAVDHGRDTLSEWRPARRAYAVPLALLVVGVLLTVIADHGSWLVGLGVALVSISAVTAIVIAIKRSGGDDR